MAKQPQHILSKSTFMYGCQCPKRLYLHKFKPGLANPEDEQQEAKFATGTDIGLLARYLFPGGVSAEPPDAFSYHLAVEKTKIFLAENQPIIYEAAFNFQGVLCAIDILVKKDGKFYAYEVKGANSIKPPYELDTSLQHFVISQSGLPVADMSIIHFDRNYVRIGELEVDKLFKIQSVLDTVNSKKEFVEQKIAEFKQLIADKKDPETKPGHQCEVPYPCNFSIHCWAGIKEEAALGENNCDKKAIREFLGQMEYPLFFFDFETIMPGVPEFDYSRPYQQVPMQYSLHKQEAPGSEVEHMEYLGDGVSDPREELIKTLIKNVGTKGSILVWYQTFEISRINELARDFPKYADALQAIIERIIDLYVPFKKGWYELPEFGGSASLKVVLPVLIPELSYHDLEIQEGGTASFIYSQINNQPADVQATQRKQLLEYCGRDTYALVQIKNRLDKI